MKLLKAAGCSIFAARGLLSPPRFSSVKAFAKDLFKQPRCTGLYAALCSKGAHRSTARPVRMFK
jgi:hypothetical protein